MYGIFPYIWLIFMVNVGKYTIHGWYGKGEKNPEFPEFPIRLQDLIFGVAVQDLVGHHLQELLGLAPDVPGGWKLGSNG